MIKRSNLPKNQFKAISLLICQGEEDAPLDHILLENAFLTTKKENNKSVRYVIEGYWSDLVLCAFHSYHSEFTLRKRTFENYFVLEGIQIVPDSSIGESFVNANQFIENIWINSKFGPVRHFLAGVKILGNIAIHVEHDARLHIEAKLSKDIKVSASMYGYDNQTISEVNSMLHHIHVDWSSLKKKLFLKGTTDYILFNEKFLNVPTAAVYEGESMELIVDQKYNAIWKYFEYFAMHLDVKVSLADLNHIINILGETLYLNSIEIEPSGEIWRGSVRLLDSEKSIKILMPNSLNMEYVKDIIISTYSGVMRVECSVDNAFRKGNTERVYIFMRKTYYDSLHVRILYNQKMGDNSRISVCFRESTLFQICNLSEEDFRSKVPLFFENKLGVHVQIFQVDIPLDYEVHRSYMPAKYLIGMDEDAQQVVLEVPGFPSEFVFDHIEIQAEMVRWDEFGRFLPHLTVSFSLNLFNSIIRSSKSIYSETEVIKCPSFRQMLDTFELVCMEPGFNENILQSPFRITIRIDWYTLQFKIKGAVSNRKVTVILQYDTEFIHKRKVIKCKMDQTLVYFLEFKGQTHNFYSQLYKNRSFFSDMDLITN